MLSIFNNFFHAPISKRSDSIFNTPVYIKLRHSIQLFRITKCGRIHSIYMPYNKTLRSMSLQNTTSIKDRVTFILIIQTISQKTLEKFLFIFVILWLMLFSNEWNTWYQFIQRKEEQMHNSQSPISTKQNQRSWWSLELSTGKYEYRLILMKCFSLRVLIYNYMYIYFIFYMHMIWDFKNAPIVILKYIINSKKIHQFKFIILCLKVHLL